MRTSHKRCVPRLASEAGKQEWAGAGAGAAGCTDGGLVVT